MKSPNSQFLFSIYVEEKFPILQTFTTFILIYKLSNCKIISFHLDTPRFVLKWLS